MSEWNEIPTLTYFASTDAFGDLGVFSQARRSKRKVEARSTKNTGRQNKGRHETSVELVRLASLLAISVFGAALVAGVGVSLLQHRETLFQHEPGVGDSDAGLKQPRILSQKAKPSPGTQGTRAPSVEPPSQALHAPGMFASNFTDPAENMPWYHGAAWEPVPGVERRPARSRTGLRSQRSRYWPRYRVASRRGKLRGRHRDRGFRNRESMLKRGRLQRRERPPRPR